GSSGLGQAPRSASATASVIPAVTAARRSSLYWPSGTWHMKRYRGDFGGAPATYTSGRWMHTHARCRPTSLLASTPSCSSSRSVILATSSRPASRERAPSGMYAASIGIWSSTSFGPAGRSWFRTDWNRLGLRRPDRVELLLVEEH